MGSILEKDILIEELNAPQRETRLEALRVLIDLAKTGVIQPQPKCGNVNNHIHTVYSFSPYSPSKAIYLAWESGLETAGIMDHDSLGGAVEFAAAGKIAGVATTVGVELRADMSKTPLNGRRINNPDQKGVAYVAIHGIPASAISDINTKLEPFRAARNKRNRAMCDRINGIFSRYGMSLDFDEDILPISMADESGSVTERHLMYALAKKIDRKFPSPDEAIKFLGENIGMRIGAGVARLIRLRQPGLYLYDLLGLLKAELIPRIYIDANDECMSVDDFIVMARESGGIPTYAYLGDIGDSVTGDKRAQSFEDSYLEELFEIITGLGFQAVTYMPTRNTPYQLEKVIRLCDHYNLFQISGEDINSPRQSFICAALTEKQYRHLSDSAWALIGHENIYETDPRSSIFAESIVRRFPEIRSRVSHFAELARGI